MSNSELKELCKQRKIRGYGGKNKDTLLHLLGVEAKLEKEPHSEFQTDPVEPRKELQADPIESPPDPRDPFEMSGPFTYIFQRSSHLEPIEPKPSEKFWKILEIVDTTRPHFLLLENVKTLVKHNEGATFKTLKEELEKRGYFHRYRILNSLEKNTHIYVTCLRAGETIEENSYYSEKVEEARISILINPIINKKYFFKNETSTWAFNIYEKNSAKPAFIRMHVMKNITSKPAPPLANSSSLSLRQSFCFDDFGVYEPIPTLE